MFVVKAAMDFGHWNPYRSNFPGDLMKQVLHSFHKGFLSPVKVLIQLICKLFIKVSKLIMSMPPWFFGCIKLALLILSGFLFHINSNSILVIFETKLGGGIDNVWNRCTNFERSSDFIPAIFPTSVKILLFQSLIIFIFPNIGS